MCLNTNVVSNMEKKIPIKISGFLSGSKIKVTTKQAIQQCLERVGHIPGKSQLPHLPQTYFEDLNDPEGELIRILQECKCGEDF